MVTESPVTMLSEMGMRPLMGGVGGDGFGGEEVGFLLQEQRRQEASDRERELNIFRSGSAPPTVEGSLNAVRGLFGGDGAGGLRNASGAENGNGFLTEEELRSHPAYHAYYYSQVNLNPRLPPPLGSREDWRSTQRFQPGSSKLGRIGDRRKANQVEEGSRSLFSMQPGSGEWLDKRGDGLIGLPGIVLDRKKSFIDIFQDDVGHTMPILCNPSRPTSRNAFDSGSEPLGSTKAQFSLNQESGSVDGLQSSGNVKNVAMVQSNGLSASHTFASVVGSSLSRSATPDPQVSARAPSPCFPPVGVRPGGSDRKTNNGSCSFSGATSHAFESTDLVAALSGLSLAPSGAIDEKLTAQSELFHEIDDRNNFLLDMHGIQNQNKQHPYLKNSGPEQISMSSFPQSVRPSYRDLAEDTGGLVDLTNSTFRPNGLVEPRINFSSDDSYLKAPSAALVANRDGSPYAKVDNVNIASSYGLSGFCTSSELPSMIGDPVSANNWPPLFGNAAVASAGIHPRAVGGGLSSQSNLTGADGQNLNRIGNEAAAAAAAHHMPVDPLYIQYLRAAEFAAQPPMERGYMGNSYGDLLGIHKAYLGGLLQPQKPHGMPFLSTSGSLNHGYYGNSAFGFGMSYPRSPLASPVLSASPAGPGSPLGHCERNIRFPSGMRNLPGGVMGSWHTDASTNMDDSYASSLLEEFKNNKTKSYELSDIAGHIVEFSADQYGSRFIQQKLETATTEEKNMVFAEIMPQALTLMTDVFGNYVVQKFFEHGSAAQRRELADQLSGHVLALSLQMYGCRVIQKAIEVVDLDQKTKLVAELDGYVMRCVRDQNGNHVIQKCIECIPQDAIQFIVSTFYDQVVTLSTHPYGCRVIQRVLEHCDDPKTQQILMDAIFQSVCMLAQDQYGNYVVQHVLEHGKPHERSAIIKKLAGQIVQMSQQKFASNVVEKCLTFGGPVERQILVNEMLGSTEENEPLQAMMKDQFGNYVVQKVLETCDEQQRELILTRIKVHLSALKKYTYGKHIVARVEKLVAAGERRIGMQSMHTS